MLLLRPSALVPVPVWSPCEGRQRDTFGTCSGLNELFKYISSHCWRPSGTAVPESGVLRGLGFGIRGGFLEFLGDATYDTMRLQAWLLNAVRREARVNQLIIPPCQARVQLKERLIYRRGGKGPPGLCRSGSSMYSSLAERSWRFSSRLLSRMHHAVVQPPSLA